MQPTRHSHRARSGWLVIGRHPGQSVLIDEHELTYLRRHANGGAIFSTRRPDGTSAGLVLKADTIRHFCGAEIKWSPRSSTNGSNIRIAIRAPQHVAIRRSELLARTAVMA